VRSNIGASISRVGSSGGTPCRERGDDVDTAAAEGVLTMAWAWGFDNARSPALIVNAQKVFADERRAHGVVSPLSMPNRTLGAPNGHRGGAISLRLAVGP
jgi:hypothetical protein